MRREKTNKKTKKKERENSNAEKEDSPRGVRLNHDRDAPGYSHSCRDIYSEQEGESERKEGRRMNNSAPSCNK